MSQFIWFCIGAMFGIFLAAMLASGRQADMCAKCQLKQWLEDNREL